MSNFSPSGPSGLSTTASRSKTSPVIQNISLPVAGTEYSVTIPVDSVAFSIRNRLCSKMQLSFISGDSGTNYITIWPGETYSEEGLTDTASITLYVQSTKASEVLEVWSWT